jgi:hypothetical protein
VSLYAFLSSHWVFVSAGILGLAVTSTWRSFTLRPVGLALAVSYAASNAVHYYLSPIERPPAYTVAEVAVLSMAFLAHVCGASRLTVAIVAVSVLSILSNFYISTYDTLTKAQNNTWELATNLCFAVECLLTAGAGWRERVGSPRWFAGWRNSAAFHGRAPGAAEAKR